MDISKRLVPYFEPVCREVFDSYLAQHGFQYLKLNSKTRVTYGSGDQVISFSYWIEDAPRYVVGVGLDVGNYDTEKGADLSDLVPIDDHRAKYWGWEFNDADSLHQIFLRIRDNVLPRYALPFWQQTDLLQNALNRVESGRQAKEASDEANKLRNQAAAAFRNKNFQEAVHLYRKISPIDLSPADQKRLEISLKKTRAPNTS